MLCRNTGYDELSLSSLSTSDHSRLEDILDELNSWAETDHVSLSLPSLRVDNFSQSLVEKTTKVRKSGLTFAAEAGTQRLRDVINKNVTWDQIERGCRIAFSEGYIYNYGIIRYKKSEFNTVSPDDYVCCRETNLSVECLIHDKVAAKKRYQNLIIDNASIEDIMLFYIKGGVK